MCSSMETKNVKLAMSDLFCPGQTLSKKTNAGLSVAITSITIRLAEIQIFPKNGFSVSSVIAITTCAILILCIVGKNRSNCIRVWWCRGPEILAWKMALLNCHTYHVGFHPSGRKKSYCIFKRATTAPSHAHTFRECYQLPAKKLVSLLFMTIGRTNHSS